MRSVTLKGSVMPAHRLAPDQAAFYRAHGAFCDPGDLAHWYADLPADPTGLARIARDLVIHRCEGELFGCTIAADRLGQDAETRYVDQILRLLTARNGASLTRRREAGDRFVGVCRDFVLLHCSFLRHAGVPARMRVGFADYFGGQPLHGDHVVTEYWHPVRGWMLADPQLADPAVAAAFTVDFDPMDVPRDRFLVAGWAWRAVRAGQADPMTFGHGHPQDPMAGEWFIAHMVRLDLAALNKAEMLLWDIWGTDADNYRDVAGLRRDLYDQVAETTSGDVAFDPARALFAHDDRLRTPHTVYSLAPYNGPRNVSLRGCNTHTSRGSGWGL
jgi:hypothetical protein